MENEAEDRDELKDEEQNKQTNLRLEYVPPALERMTNRTGVVPFSYAKTSLVFRLTLSSEEEEKRTIPNGSTSTVHACTENEHTRQDEENVD